jgi:hypothetical protein
MGFEDSAFNLAAGMEVGGGIDSMDVVLLEVRDDCSLRDTGFWNARVSPSAANP